MEMASNRAAWTDNWNKDSIIVVELELTHFVGRHQIHE